MKTAPAQSSVRSSRQACGWSKANGGWTADITDSSEKGHQVKCLIASEGWQWMRSYFDQLPATVRRRLAVSRFNICPACMDEEAHRRAAVPSVKIYIETIEAIEREMDCADKHEAKS